MKTYEICKKSNFGRDFKIVEKIKAINPRKAARKFLLSVIPPKSGNYYVRRQFVTHQKFTV